MRIVLAMLDMQRTDPSAPPRTTIGTASALRLLAARLREAGWVFDTYPGTTAIDGSCVVLWDFGSFAVPPRTLLAGRLIAWNLESPLVAHRAFARIPAIARASHTVMTFPGAAALTAGEGRFVPICYPNRRRDVASTADWEHREFLVMLNSNKRARPGLEMMSWRKPYRAARIAAARVVGSIRRLRGELPPDLYEARLDALAHFLSRRDFSLYGVGWDRKVVGRTGLDVSACYRGAADDKSRVLSRFKFCLCFENTAFPGYITEKIFDCFFSGTIPVYQGAPDVARYVPPDSFVDAGRFRDLRELERYLRDITAENARLYLDAAGRFIRSERFAPFTDESFVATFLDVISDAAA